MGLSTGGCLGIHLATDCGAMLPAKVRESDCGVVLGFIQGETR